MTKSETQKYVMELREENAKLCEENERIRQNSVNHEVYIGLLKKYVDLLEENERLKNKYDNLDAKFTNMMTDYENKITKNKIAIARLKEKEVTIKPTHNVDGETFPQWYCPNCKEYLDLNEFEQKQQYCGNCGQHIDWRD